MNSGLHAPGEPQSHPWFIYLFIFETGSCCVTHGGVELVILSQPSECWDYRYSPLCIVIILAFVG
jgi:hypothetical protein